MLDVVVALRLHLVHDGVVREIRAVAHRIGQVVVGSRCGARDRCLRIIRQHVSVEGRARYREGLALLQRSHVAGCDLLPIRANIVDPYLVEAGLLVGRRVGGLGSSGLGCRLGGACLRAVILGGCGLVRRGRAGCLICRRSIRRGRVGGCRSILGRAGSSRFLRLLGRCQLVCEDLSRACHHGTRYRQGHEPPRE